MSLTKRVAASDSVANTQNLTVPTDPTESQDIQKNGVEEWFEFNSLAQGFKPWRIFINHIDCYHGQKLAEFLPENVYVNPQSSPEKGVVSEEDERTEGEEVESEDEDDEKMYEATPTLAKTSSRKYEVIGTTLDPEYPHPEDVAMIIKNTKEQDKFLSELMNCGIIIYDITEDLSQVEEASWAIKCITKELEKVAEETPKAFKRNTDVRYFILISPIMTWALTNPLSKEELDVPLTEEDFKKRRSHPNFKKHIECERDVLTVKKKGILADKLKTLVICCGITYGYEEGPLDYLFKNGWKNAESLPIIGEGNNKIPLLHVHDLFLIVLSVLKSWPKIRYILAMEQELISQRTIVKKISKALTTGKVVNLEKGEAFLLPDMKQQTYDMMTINLKVDPAYIIDKISWHLDLPFRDSIDIIVKEYKIARNLIPVKIIVLGPPASGKTVVSRYLEKYYNIHYIHVESLVKETLETLAKRIEAASLAVEQDESGTAYIEDYDDDDLSDDKAISVEELKDQLDEIEKNFEDNDGRLDDVLLNKLFLKRLQSKDCSNQGYVLDGYPKTFEQAKDIFGEASLYEDEDYSSIIPELVVALEASDDFLKERMINRPEKEIQDTHYTEVHMLRRLKEYRKRNTDEYTPLQFFDEIEVHPLFIGIENDICPEMFPTIYQCLQKIGEPRSYGLTAEEADKVRKRAAEDAHEAKMAEKLQKEKKILDQKRRREEKMIEWTNLMQKLKEEEEERLALLGQPLRHYLVKFVFPTLTKGLIEVAKLRPDDPVDFLAEYLFKENPEGKMFEPDYTETMSTILDAIEKLKDDLLPLEELDERTIMFLKTECKHPSPSESGAGVCVKKEITPPIRSPVSDEDFEIFEGEMSFKSDSGGP